MKDKEQENAEEKIKKGNTCIGMGVGLGAISAGAAVVTGAVCPFCYVAVPALVGVGIYERQKGKKQKGKEEQAIKTNKKPDLEKTQS